MILEKELQIKLPLVKSLSSLCFNSEGRVIHKFNGKVEVEAHPKDSLIFNESIKWENGDNLLINSKNIYRWTFLEFGNIKLEHLRFGTDHPVFLVELAKSGEKKWKSIEPHKCGMDLYSAELYLKNKQLVLIWTVKGPTENYALKTVYSTI